MYIAGIAGVRLSSAWAAWWLLLVVLVLLLLSVIVWCLQGIPVPQSVDQQGRHTGSRVLCSLAVPLSADRYAFWQELQYTQFLPVSYTHLTLPTTPYV